MSDDSIRFHLTRRVVEAYDFAEVAIHVDDPVVANPFTDVRVEGRFWPATEAGDSVPVEGFCDTDDGTVNRIRFMPARTGEHRFAVSFRRATGAPSPGGAAPGSCTWRAPIRRPGRAPAGGAV